MAAKKVIDTVTVGVAFASLDDLTGSGLDSMRPAIADNTLPQDYLDAGVNRAAWFLSSVVLGASGGLVVFELRPIA